MTTEWIYIFIAHRRKHSIQRYKERGTAPHASQFEDAIAVARPRYHFANVICLFRINNLINYLPKRGFGFVFASDI